MNASAKAWRQRARLQLSSRSWEMVLSWTVAPYSFSLSWTWESQSFSSLAHCRLQLVLLGRESFNPRTQLLSVIAWRTTITGTAPYIVHVGLVACQKTSDTPCDWYLFSQYFLLWSGMLPICPSHIEPFHYWRVTVCFHLQFNMLLRNRSTEPHQTELGVQLVAYYWNLNPGMKEIPRIDNLNPFRWLVIKKQAVESYHIIKINRIAQPY